MKVFCCIPADHAIQLDPSSTCQPFGPIDDDMTDVFVWLPPLRVLSVPQIWGVAL